MARGRPPAPNTLVRRLMQMSFAELLAELPRSPLEVLPSRFGSILEYRIALQVLVLEEARHAIGEAARALVASARAGSRECAVIEVVEMSENEAPSAEPTRVRFRIRRPCAELARASRAGGCFLLRGHHSASAAAADRQQPPAMVWRIGVIDSSSREVGALQLVMNARVRGNWLPSDLAAAGSSWDAFPLVSVLSCQRMWAACEHLPRLRFESELLGRPPALHLRFADSDGEGEDEDEEREGSGCQGAEPGGDDAVDADIVEDADEDEHRDIGSTLGSDVVATATSPAADADAGASLPLERPRVPLDELRAELHSDGLLEQLCASAASEAARRTYSELNASQRAAVDSLLAAVSADEDGPSGECAARPGDGVSLLQGPPGTGKTATIVAALCALAARPAARGQRRVLVCAPSNQAVSLLLQRFLQALTPLAPRALPAAGEALDEALSLAIGADDALSPAEIAGWPLARVALIGVEERLGVPLGAPVVAGPPRGGAGGGQGRPQLPVGCADAAMAKALGRCFVHTFASSTLAELRAARSAQGSSSGPASAEAVDLDRTARLERIRRRLRANTPSFWKRCVSAPMRSLRRALRSQGRARARGVDGAVQSLEPEAACADAGAGPTVDQAWAAVARALSLGLSASAEVRSSPLGAPGAAAADDGSAGFEGGGGGGRAAAASGSDAEAVVGELVRGARFLFCTLSSAGRQAVREHCGGPGSHWRSGAKGRGRSALADADLLIVDEAAQALEAELLIPIASCPPRRVWLVGDPLQLPATVLSPHAARAGLAVSCFERLALGCNHAYACLAVQYRMHRQIAEWPARAYYEHVGLATAGAALLRHEAWHSSASFEPSPSSSHREGFLGPLAFIDVASAVEEADGRTGSLRNRAEAQLACMLVRHLRDRWRVRIDAPSQLRVITFYRAQVELIERALRAAGVHGVSISTVDSVQGGEARIVILSCVRAAHALGLPKAQNRASIGFLRDHRRLNVALTRAQSSLVVLGHALTLTASSRPLSEGQLPGVAQLVHALRERSLVFAEAEVVHQPRRSLSNVGPRAPDPESADDPLPDDPHEVESAALISNLGHRGLVVTAVLSALRKSGLSGCALLSTVHGLIGRPEVGHDGGLSALVAAVEQELGQEQGRKLVRFLVARPLSSTGQPRKDAYFEVEGMEGLSIADIARHGIGRGADQLAEVLECACSGVMACSTCQVVVEREWFARVGEPDQAELDMLDLAYEREETSRLGCQLVLRPELDGLRVRIPHGANNMMDSIPFPD